MKRILSRLGFGAVLLSLGSGCSEDDFDPYNRVNSLRVLAVRSEPVAPAPGESTELSALLFVPEGQSEPEYTWSWCPFPGTAEDGYPCEVDEQALSKLAGPIELPDLDLGSGETATFTHSLPLELLTALCERVPGSTELPNCGGGFPVQLKLTVKTDRDEVTAVRTLRLLLDEEAERNQNPSIDGVEARVKGDWQQLDDSADVMLPRNEETKLRATVSDDQSEEYSARDRSGQEVAVREQLTMTWFVESGDTRWMRTGYIHGVTDPDVFRENEWIPEKTEDYEPDQAQLVLVLRDDREGVGWRHARVSLEDKP